ncbi:hypothetical protein [Poseidonibacter sp.]|uniref:hypothetical protein n=1 Tax=Poseidonibacter sp. TaxID=2321188 RepID=UPI003C720AFD
MLELIKKDYTNRILPAHYEIYNISNEQIEGLKETKLLQLPRLHYRKFKKGVITTKELEKQYFRGLDSRGQHLISVDYGACSVIVCGCDTYKHNDTCPIPYLKKYLKIKNMKIDKYL